MVEIAMMENGAVMMEEDALRKNMFVMGGFTAVMDQIIQAQFVKHGNAQRDIGNVKIINASVMSMYARGTDLKDKIVKMDQMKCMNCVPAGCVLSKSGNAPKAMNVLPNILFVIMDITVEMGLTRIQICVGYTHWIF